jgi:hypothetical protein
MLKFNQDSRRVSIDAKTIQIQNLKIIWDQDTTKLKEKATKLLTYVHLVSQLDDEAPYYNSSFSEVRPLVKRDVFGDYEYNLPDGGEEVDEDFEDFMEEAIAQYQKAYETVEQRSYRAIVKKIDQTRELIDETDPELKQSTVRGAVTYASNFPLLNKMIQELIPLQDTADELKARIKKESTDEGTIRAGKKLSIIEERLKKAKQKKMESQVCPSGDEEEIAEF